MNAYPEWNAEMSRRADEYEREEMAAAQRRMNAIAEQAKAAKAKAKRNKTDKTWGQHFGDICAAMRVEIDVMRAVTGRLLAEGFEMQGRLELEVSGEITEESVAPLIAKLHAHALVEEVWVTIDSKGGFASASKRLTAALLGHIGRVITVAPRLCCSGAVDIFLAGHERWAQDSTRIVLHACEGDTPDANRAYNAAAHLIFSLRGAARRSPDSESEKAKRRGYREALVPGAGTVLTIEQACELDIVTKVIDIDAMLADEDVANAMLDSIPDTYQVRTVSGNVYHVPFNKRAVAMIATNRAALAQQAQRGQMYCFPHAYWDAANELHERMQA